MPPSIARVSGKYKSLVVATSAAILSSALLGLSPTTASAATVCGAMTSPVYERVNPTTQSGSFSVDRQQSGAGAADGFTSIRDTSILLAARTGPGLTAVHRLFRSTTGDYLYSVDAREIARVVRSLGYVDQGVGFYAAKKKTSCATPVYRFDKAGRHRFVTTVADRAELKALGWRKEGAVFYARKAPVDPTFSLAVFPDTQQEVLRAGDGRFLDRTQWLVAHRDSLDLRFVTHVGDVVNWDTPDHSQYVVARNAFDVLNTAGVPYSLSIGNHDTQATGVGGSARDPSRTHALQRDTSVFNTYLGRQDIDLEGAYEPGKVDNTFHVFTAGGKGWLVLNLELWPRPGVVAWAEKVVQTHPRHNVIVVTHAYLTAGAGIGQDNGGYGDTSPQYLYDHLIGKYANVTMVLSGHTGEAAHRVDRGVHGNRIDSFLTTIHSNSTNPIRLLQFNTRTGTLSTRVYAPWTDETAYVLSLDHRHWDG